MRTTLSLLGMLAGAIPAVSQSLPQPLFTSQVVVTASLEEEERRVLPASIEVIQAEEIRLRQATLVADLLATMPGLAVVRSGSPGQVTSLFTRGTESDHTLVLWNGIELNNPYFGGYDWAFLPTEGVERVEVARGPFSSAYGSDAIGGVVQVISGRRDGGSIDLEAGEDSYLRGAINAGTSVGRAHFDVAGHLRSGEGELPNDVYDSEEIVGRFDIDLTSDVTLGLVARANDSDVGIPLSGGQPSLERSIRWRERELAVPFSAEWQQWSFEAQLSRVTFDSAFRDPQDSFGFTSSDTESESLRGRAVASYRFADGSWFAFGGESESLEVDDRSVFGVNLAGEDQETRAVFAEGLYARGKVSIDAGVRYDDNDVFGSKVSPRMGVAVDFGNGTRAHAAYGEAFRAPSIGELFFPFSGNPNLEPETSESLELSLEHATGRWLYRLTAFETDLENLIDFDFSTFTNVNVGRARSRGAEVEVALGGESLQVRWNGTWLDTEDRSTGLPLLRRAEISSNLVMMAGPREWPITLTARYVGERDDVDPVTFARAVNGSYLRFDLAARHQLTESLTPYVRIENAADHEYAEALGFPAPGRRWVGGLAIDF